MGLLGSIGDALGGVGDLVGDVAGAIVDVGGAVQTVGQVFNPPPPVAPVGQGPVPQFIPGVPGAGFQTPVLFGAGGGLNTFGEGLAQSIVGDEGTFFHQTPQSVRANRDIMRMNPVTGTPNFWRSMGRPVLFTGDLATCKRVRKIAAKAKRARP